jgi:hypothetical protein
MMSETVRRTKLAGGVEIVTIRADDNPYACRPYQVYALANGVCGHRTDYASKAAALMAHDRLVTAATRQSGEGRRMPTGKGARERRGRG